MGLSQNMQPMIVIGSAALLGFGDSFTFLPLYFLTLAGRCQLAMLICLARDTVKALAAVLLVKVEPPPTVPPAPKVMGATSTQLLPTCTSASITVRCLFAPS